MTRITPAYGSKKVLEITYPTPFEELLATPEPLPTVEPEFPQVDYLITASDLPTLSLKPYSLVYVGCLYAGGKNTSAGALTVYWRMLKNAVSVATGSISVSAGYYWTVSCFFFGIQPSDHLQLSLWASALGANWDYYAVAVEVTRVLMYYPYDKDVFKPCNFVSITAHPTLTLGNPVVYSTAVLLPQHVDVDLPGISAPKNYDILASKAMGLFRTNYGDATSANSGLSNTSSTYRPYYRRNYVPTKIEMRQLKIDKMV